MNRRAARSRGIQLWTLVLGGEWEAACIRGGSGRRGVGVGWLGCTRGVDITS